MWKLMSPTIPLAVSTFEKQPVAMQKKRKKKSIFGFIPTSDESTKLHLDKHCVRWLVGGGGGQYLLSCVKKVVITAHSQKKTD